MNTNRKIYVFYFTVILLAVLAMMVFDLNIIIKAILCFLIFSCLMVMRSIKRAYDLADDVDPDTLEKVTSLTDDYAIGDEKRNHDSNLDFYLNLLIKTDEELSKDPTIMFLSSLAIMILNVKIFICFPFCCGIQPLSCIIIPN